jgi:D-2-hydroxyacid dehydrogenase (NADP+)
MEQQTIAVYQNSRIPMFTIREKHILRLSKELPWSRVVWCRSSDELTNILPVVDTLLTWRFKQEWFAMAPRLRWIGTPAAGRDLFEITRIPEDVQIRNGTFHGAFMAETALGMILAVNRGILTALRHQLQGELWPRSALFESRVVAGTHAVILGFGHIGQHIGRLLKPLGIKITGIRRHVESAPPVWFDGCDRVLGLEQMHNVLPQADHLVAVLPSDTGTDKLLNNAAFAAMPRHAVLYNLGRGNCVDEEDLAHALRTGMIAGACLDVFAQEPLTEDSPLADDKLPGLLRMPHASAFCDCYLDRYLDEFIAWLKNSV